MSSLHMRVRKAETAEETNALQLRLKNAFDSAHAGGYARVLNAFGEAVSKSSAVIARRITEIDGMLEDETKTYTNYYYQVMGGARVPNNNVDQIRLQFENALFPNYSQEIRYGALSINGKGLSSFGEYFMELKEEMISHRSTVFEENPLVFGDRQGLGLTDLMPPGYRATWLRRGDLAQAKLYSELSASTVANDFPSILMRDTGTSGAADYIEVHIYGTFNRSAIACVRGPDPKSREDRILWRKFKKKAAAAGIDVEAID